MQHDFITRRRRPRQLDLFEFDNTFRHDGVYSSLTDIIVLYRYAASSNPCFLISAESSQTMALVRASIS